MQRFSLMAHSGQSESAGVKADDDFAAFETMAFGECVKYDTVEALGTMSIRQP